MKRTAAILVSAIMTVAMCSTAFADVIEYNIDDDNVTIDSGNEDGYLIYSSSRTRTNHKIIVNGVKTTITLENVNIETNDGSSALDIGDDANVNLVISGNNVLSVTGSDTAAGIHISGGTLTISGTDADDDNLTVFSTDPDGAAIGSDSEEDFTGIITIDDGVTVTATVGGDGAGIGSGYHGQMSGEIIINGGNVDAESSGYGAGIGAGDVGEYEEGAIGVSGTITINGGNVYAYSDDGGAGIGAGDYGEMSGNIIINGGSVEAVSGDDGVGIGSGDYNMSGHIVINGGNVTAICNNYDVSIGAGYGVYGLGRVTGDITIFNNAVVTLGSNNVIGSGYESSGTIYLYKGAQINGITVSDVDELKDAGILNDNMEVVLLESNSGHTYSLNKLSLVTRIRAAKSGDKVYVNESELSKSKLPYYALEALAGMDNVTLVVVASDGQTVEINSASVPKEGINSFFTVDELLEMAK